MVIRATISSKPPGLRPSGLKFSDLFFSTAGGVPGTISEMAESWKIEQTCETGPAPVVDASAPCANHEARREWAEKECHMVRHFPFASKVDHCYLSLSIRFWINPIEIHSHLVSRSWTKRSFDNSISNVSTMLASRFHLSSFIDRHMSFLFPVVIPEAIASVCVLLWLPSQRNVNRSMFRSNGARKTNAVSASRHRPSMDPEG